MSRKYRLKTSYLMSVLVKWNGRPYIYIITNICLLVKEFDKKICCKCSKTSYTLLRPRSAKKVFAPLRAEKGLSVFPLVAPLLLRKHIVFIGRIICDVPCAINSEVGAEVLASAAGARGSLSLCSFGGFAIRSAHPFIYFLH